MDILNVTTFGKFETFIFLNPICGPMPGTVYIESLK